MRLLMRVAYGGKGRMVKEVRMVKEALRAGQREHRDPQERRAP